MWGLRPRAVVLKFSKIRLKYRFLMFMHTGFYIVNYIVKFHSIVRRAKNWKQPKNP